MAEAGKIPLQVILLHKFVAYRTLPPSFAAEGKIVKDAGPAVDVAAACHFGSLGRIQAYRAIRFLKASEVLKIGQNQFFQA